jgi:hypothetical protein
MAKHTLNQRELNRATLARQFLLERSSLAPSVALEHLVAMQGQVSNAPYIGLWTRLQDFQRADLAALIERREVVRASSLRCTLHLLRANDYFSIHPLLQPKFSRNLHIFASHTPDFDLASFTAEMRAYIQERPRTAAELRLRMAELYSGMGQPRIVDAVRIYLALVQTLPAGLWGFTGKPKHTEASSWLGPHATVREGGMQDLFRRYLAAFGPATVQDFQAWSGLAGVKQALDVQQLHLLTFRDEHGRELLDLPDAPRPPADTPAPVRFLPDFDNLLFSHADRSRVLAENVRTSLFVDNSTCAAFLVDGFVRGRWKIKNKESGAALSIETLDTLDEPTRQKLESEGRQLIAWVFGGTQPFEIEFRIANVSSVRNPQSA